jgi:hypothetical protein
MPLEPQTIELSLAGGVDLKTDPRLVVAPNNLQAQNVRWPSAGAVDQRYGQTVLPTTVGGSQTIEIASVSGPSINLLNYNESTGGDAGSIAGFLPLTAGEASYNSPANAGYILATVTSTPWGPVEQGTNAIHWVSGSGAPFNAPYQDGVGIQVPCLPNTQYTFSSFYGDTTGGSGVSFNLCDNTGNANSSSHSNTANTWQRFSVTLTTSNTATHIQLQVNWQFRVGTPNFYLDALQLQTGSSATAWVIGAGAPIFIPVIETLAISSGSSVGTTNSGELLEHAGNELYAYSESSAVWLPRGQVQSFEIQTAALGPSLGTPRGVASAVSGNIQVTAYEDTTSGSCSYMVYDLQNRAVILGPTVLSLASSNPVAVTIDASIYVFCVSPIGIKGVRIDTAAPWKTPVPYMAMSGEFKALKATTDGTHIFFGVEALATSFVSFYSFQVNPWEQVTSNISFSVSPGFDIRWDSSTGLLLVASYQGGALSFFTLNSSLGIVANSAFVDPNAPSAPSNYVIESTGTGTAAVYFEFSGLETEYVCTLAFTSTTITATLSQIVINALHPASYALNGLAIFSTRQTVPPGLTPTNQQTYFLCQIDPVTGQPRPIFQFFSQVAASGSRGANIPELYLYNSTLVTGLLQATALRVSASGTIYTAATLVSISLTPSAVNDAIEEATSETLVGAGNLYAYDGINLVESGFWLYPEGIVATVFPNSGSVPVVPPSGVQNSAQVFYQITYEWVDAAGNSHYSAPSFVVGGATGLTVFPGSAITLVIPTLQVTLRQNVTIGIYRAAMNTASPMYRVASIPNNPALQTITYTDAAADSTIEGQPFLYAPADGSGEVENSTPPSMNSLVVTKNRAFGLSAENPYQLWYSKPLVPGREVQWSDVFTIQVEWAGGPCVALGYVDQYALIFKRDRIYFLPGDGPDATGLNGSFSALQTISVSGGCSNPQSIVSTADGCWFLSPLGLAFIAKGSLTPNYQIGLPVQPLARSLTITGGQVVPDLNYVRWTSKEGTSLVFDYVLQQWHTDTNYAAVSTAVWQNSFVRLQTNGQVYYEDTTRYDDNGEPVIALIETSYIKPSSLTQGYGAVWYASILGTYYSSHTLLAAVEYDYLGAPSHIHTFNATVNGNLGTYGDAGPYGFNVQYGTSVKNAYTAPYQPRIAFRRQTCQAVKLTLSIQAGATQRALTLTTLAIQLGTYGGLNRVPMRQDV